MTADTTMRRTAGVTNEPEDRADVVDFVADYARDAADAGVNHHRIASALREAADEIEMVAREEGVDPAGCPEVGD